MCVEVGQGDVCVILKVEEDEFDESHLEGRSLDMDDELSYSDTESSSEDGSTTEIEEASEEEGEGQEGAGAESGSLAPGFQVMHIIKFLMF